MHEKKLFIKINAKLTLLRLLSRDTIFGVAAKLLKFCLHEMAGVIFCSRIIIIIIKTACSQSNDLLFPLSPSRA
jgi:hypothetical protein